MRAHAVVIGIDHYPKPEWDLTGAVRDAVAFARWCVTAGGVDPGDLTLLLSPVPGGPPLTELLEAHQGAPDLSARAAVANEANIRKAMRSYRTQGAGRNADRLWFYYAGHGLAPPAASPNDGPLIVPADVDDLESYVDENPIALEIFRGQMADVNPPKEQFFFIDACRDVLEVKGNKVLSQQLVWDVRKIKDEQLATQCVLFATTAGNKAKEIRGNGLFSRALLAALRGLGPELKSSPPDQPPRKRLLFNNVTEFVIDAVKRDLNQIADTQPSDLKAVVPYGGIYRLKGDVVVAEFTPNQLPTATVSAVLYPKDARNSARIEFLYLDGARDEWLPRPTNPAPAGPPVKEETQFVVQGGRHFLRVTADGFARQTPDILVYEDKTFKIELKPPDGPPAVEESITRGGDDSNGTTARITVTCPDSLARVAVVDGSGNERRRGYGTVYAYDLAPGIYHATAELTSADRVKQLVDAQAGQKYYIELDVASAPVGPTLLENLKRSNIPVAGIYVEPSENFGPVANARLASILAYAAWAARWPPDTAGFQLLRSIGVDPLPSLTLDQSALQVLIGDIADPEASFARDCRVQVESSSAALVPGHVIELGSGRQDAQPLSLESLTNFPAARQTSTLLPPGQVRLRVEMPGFAPASFALTLLRRFVTVLVISREENGEVDVQQYFNPIDPMEPVHDRFPRPQTDDVRLVELGWRALKERESLDTIEYDGLLHGKRSNPLLAIIAGYRMFGTEREEQFRVLTKQPEAGEITDSALWNMVTLFPGLPDVHVLAGLYDPARRDEHFKRAMNTGTPVMVEGFWTLVEWLSELAIREQKPAPTLRQSVLPGMVWTSFTEAERAGRIEGVHVITPTGRTQAGDASQKLAALARSVGRLEASGGTAGEFWCTAFLVTPQLLLCPFHFAVKFANEEADGSWTIQKEARVRFDLADAAGDRVVERVLGILRPPEHLDADGGTLSRAGLQQCWPVLLRLSEPAAASPLVIAREAPEAGQRVAVIGFPRSDARIPSDMFAEHFMGSAGEKHVMSGAVLRSPGNSWTLDYDCFTADGTSGGPVVDLQTGAVLGMHVAAEAVKNGRKRASAIAMTRFSEAQLAFNENELLRPPTRNEVRALE
jgi:hypothetical protein